MNMIYKDNTLFIDLDKISRKDINILKHRIFNILNQYSIDNIIINTTQGNENYYLLNNFVEEYKKNYHGIIKINNQN